MLMDSNGSWLNGGFALTLIGYGLVSAFVTGPEILARETIKAGWSHQCRAMVQAELMQSQPQPEATPQIDYRSLARNWFGRDADPFLQMLEPFGQAMDVANAQKERARRVNQERLRQKAEQSLSRCSCAVSMLSEKRIALGLYAGTGRMVTPPLFKNLIAELKAAANAPQCKAAFSQ